MINSFKILSRAFILALYYTMSDIITEVYNYREMRNLIWINPLMLYIFSEILFININFSIKNSTQIDIPYYIVFSLFLKHIITYLFHCNSS